MKKTNTLAKWFICLVLIYVFICFVARVDSIVVRKGTITTIEQNVVNIEDKSGNIWQWKMVDDEKYNIGQTVSMIMDTNNTEDTIEDDIIVKIKLDS